MKTAALWTVVAALASGAAAKSAKSEDGYCNSDTTCEMLANSYACVTVHTTRENAEDANQCMSYKASGDVCAGTTPGPCPSFTTWSKEFKSISSVCAYLLPSIKCAAEDAVTTGTVACLNVTASSNLATYGVIYGCVDYDGTKLLLLSTSKTAMMVTAFNYSEIIRDTCMSSTSAAGSDVVCSGHGTCAPKTVGQMDYACLCNVGYSGAYCQKIDSNKCTMKAQCAAGTCNLVTQECECEAGTKGKQCAECDPTSASACNKHGTCGPVSAPGRRFLMNAASSSASASSSMMCTCETGYAGAHCDRVVTVAQSTSSQNQTTIKKDEPTTDKTAVTIAIVAGVIVFVAAVATLIVCRRCRRHRRNNKLDDELLSPSTRGMGSTTPGYAPSQSTTPERGTLTQGGSSGKSADNRSSSDVVRSSGSSQQVPQGGLWDDDVIVAARVPREKVLSETLLSRGGFGEVYRGTYNGQVVAIKTLLPEARKNMKQINAFLSEIRLMASFEHERIVTFIGVAWDSLADLCVVSEFMDGGDLRSVLAGFKQAERPQGFDHDKVKIAVHIAHALTYLHSLQPVVLHRDLKSKNILLNRRLNAKLTDFGISRERSNQTMTAGIGSSLWMSPEVMLGGRYDDKADVFSFGVVLSELDSHVLPYAHVTESSESPGPASSQPHKRRRIPETAILQMISSGRLHVRFSSDANPAIVALGNACVALDPKDRPTAAEVLFTLHTALKSL